MAELVVNIPDELAQIKGLHVNWQSRKLRHLLFKALVSESKLTEEDAMELGRDINESMLKDLKNKGLI